MKRLFLGAAVVAALMSAFVARPVQAGGVAQAQNTAIDLANQLAEGVPSPSGWQVRHVCLSVEQLNHYWCVFVPFPY